MPARSYTGIQSRYCYGVGRSRRGGGQEDVRGLRALLVEAHLGEVDLERSLWRLAYEAHAEGPTEAEETANTLLNKLNAPGMGAAGIGELKLLKALAARNVSTTLRHRLRGV